MTFEKELSEGKFLIPQCSKCGKIVWPPSKICNSCFSSTFLRPASGKGKIISFSKTQESYFCVIEFEGQIHLICSLKAERTPSIGDTVSLLRCGINNKDYSFEVLLE